MRARVRPASPARAPLVGSRPRRALLALLGAAALAGSACRTPGRELRFEGNQALSARELRRAAADDLRDYEEHGQKSSIDDAAYAMERLYKSEGYAFATVEYELGESEPEGESARRSESPGAADEEAVEHERDERARRQVRIEVDEGPRVTLLGIEIEGNQAIPTEELRTLFGDPAQGPAPFVQADLDAAARAIERFYAAQGFLDVQVAPPEVELEPDRSAARVRVHVDEGPRYRLEAVALEGELVYPEAELRRALGLETGSVFTVRVPWEARARLIDYYAERGHADAEARIGEERDPATGAVRLSYAVTPGPVVQVGAIRVVGLEHVREALVRARLELEPGRTWSREKERKTVAALYRTGVFKTVELALEPGAGEVRDLVVRVEEGSTLEAWVEPGWGSYDLFRLAFGLTERDFLGTARTLEAQGLYSLRTQSGKLSLIDPWLFGSRVSANLSLFATRREEPAFTRLEYGTLLGFKRDWTQRFSTTLGYEFRISDASDTDVPIDSTNVNISEVALTASYDRRDSVLVTTRGDLSKAGIELATRYIGSELDFLRPTLSRIDYWRLSERLVLASAARTGLIAPTAGAEIPLQERFFNGGENSVRSFREDELGAEDANGKPLGGEAATTLNLELRRRFGASFELALFADAGNVQLDWEDYLRFSGLRYALGGGLRYYLPIGPLRLDLGGNPDPRPGEDHWVLHFSVGAAF